eukprot:COSAG01_NODE_11829_length_1851_cov_3.396689_1_plen_210_part_00
MSDGDDVFPGVCDSSDSDEDDDGCDDDDGIVVSHDLHTITEGKSVAFANFVHKVAGTIATVFPDVADNRWLMSMVDVDLRKVPGYSVDDIAEAKTELLKEHIRNSFKRQRTRATGVRRQFTQAQRLWWLSQVDAAKARGLPTPHRDALEANGYRRGTSSHRALACLLRRWHQPDVEHAIRADGAAVHPSGQRDLKRRQGRKSSGKYGCG